MDESLDWTDVPDTKMGDPIFFWRSIGSIALPSEKKVNTITHCLSRDNQCN